MITPGPEQHGGHTSDIDRSLVVKMVPHFEDSDFGSVLTPAGYQEFKERFMDIHALNPCLVGKLFLQVYIDEPDALQPNDDEIYWLGFMYDYAVDGSTLIVQYTGLLFPDTHLDPALDPNLEGRELVTIQPDDIDWLALLAS